MIYLTPNSEEWLEEVWPSAQRPQVAKDIAVINSISDKPDDIPVEHCILLVEGLEPGPAVARAQADGFHHIVPTTHPYVNFVLTTACMMIDRPEKLLTEPESLLLPHRVNTARLVMDNFEAVTKKTIKLKKVSEKTKALDELVAQLDSQPATRLLRESAISITDELLMNAFYDAPREANIKDIKKRPKAVDFFFVSDENVLLIGCRDFYGSLKVEKLLARLHTVYSQGMARAMNMGPGGAGLGLKIVLDHGLDLVAICEKQKQTLVLVTLPLGLSRRKMAALEKSIRLLEC